MPRFLVFTLAAQIASFGDLAGHERRGSDTWPGRSALLGLIGGALGVRRDDHVGQERLHALRFAVAAHEIGQPLRDYHTVQSVPSTIKRPASRADALRLGTAAGKLNTAITQRDYRTGVHYTVAVWDAEGTNDLDELLEALQRPRFVPYLGRKSCPLSLPMAPIVVEAENPVAALRSPSTVRRTAPNFIASDDFDGLGTRGGSIAWRYDDPMDRERWHFGARPVHMLRGTAMGWDA